MGLIHTAELAGANPLDYLTALLRHSDHVQQHLGLWMPWSYTEMLEDLPPARQVYRFHARP